MEDYTYVPPRGKPRGVVRPMKVYPLPSEVYELITTGSILKDKKLEKLRRNKGAKLLAELKSARNRFHGCKTCIEYDLTSLVKEFHKMERLYRDFVKMVKASERKKRFPKAKVKK